MLFRSTHGTLPKLATHNALNLLTASLEDDYTRPMATYAVAMVLNLGTSAQVATFARGIAAESLMNALSTVRSDPEKNTMDEDLADLHIYLALALLRCRPARVDVVVVKALIEEMEKAVVDSTVWDSTLAGGSDPDTSASLDRMKWKAIYLSGLLSKLLPPGEWEECSKGLRGRVWSMLQRGALPLVGDWERCIEPFDTEVPGLTTPDRPIYDAFETWIGKFPLFPLAGSTLVPPAVKAKH